MSRLTAKMQHLSSQIGTHSRMASSKCDEGIPGLTQSSWKQTTNCFSVSNSTPTTALFGSVR